MWITSMKHLLLHVYTCGAGSCFLLVHLLILGQNVDYRAGTRCRETGDGAPAVHVRIPERCTVPVTPRGSDGGGVD